MIDFLVYSPAEMQVGLLFRKIVLQLYVDFLLKIPELPRIFLVKLWLSLYR